MIMDRHEWYPRVEPNGFKVGKYALIPDATADALMAWAKNGVYPGGFLKAVLSNSLKDAINLADSNNEKALHSIVAWLWNYCPADAWGNCEKYHNWLEVGGIYGRRALWDAEEALKKDE
jgi:hypothetical protein